MRPEDLPAVMEIDALSLPTPWSEGVWRQELKSPFGLYLCWRRRAGCAARSGPGGPPTSYT